MGTFEGLKLSSINQMEVGGLYMYFHDTYAPNGVGFCLSEKHDNEGTTIFIGERCDGVSDRIVLQSGEQENIQRQVSALYLLSELKDVKST